jgi:hypothetical protein
MNGDKTVTLTNTRPSSLLQTATHLYLRPSAFICGLNSPFFLRISRFKVPAFSLCSLRSFVAKIAFRGSGSPALPSFKKLGSAPAPGAAADALVRRRERARASSHRFFLNQHPKGVPALRLNNPVFVFCG